MLLFRKLYNKILNLSIQRLESPRKLYEQRIYNNMDKLFKTIHKGDVVLVEGSSEISRIIKLFTNSYWSHSSIYVGDELIKPGSPDREKYQNKFGIDADHLIIEASSCNEFQVICSGMIAKSFQKVGYPIVPALDPLAKTNQLVQDNPYGSKLIMRHYSQIMPRDFDISPNFEVIKFNIIGSEKFDYKFLWKDTLN